MREAVDSGRGRAEEDMVGRIGREERPVEGEICSGWITFMLPKNKSATSPSNKIAM